MRYLATALLIVILLHVVSCRKENQETQAPSMPMPAAAPVAAPAKPAQHAGLIQEVLQATEYTYLHVQEDEQVYWIAIRKSERQVGETITFLGGLEMRNFVSKDLDRTFESVLFVDQVVDSSAMAPHPTMPSSPHATPAAPGKPVVGKQTVTIEPLADGVTIGDIFGNRATHAGQIITVKEGNGFPYLPFALAELDPPAGRHRK
ncbi:hypothetical protein ACFL6U_23300 [Planctomycetota bacterium]